MISFLLWGRKSLNREPPAQGQLIVHYIDVGQGDCTLLISDGVTMLIDCGYAVKSGRVTSYISSLGISRLDYVIGTHPHSDHMGGMADIISSFEVGEVIIPHLRDEDVPTTVFFERFLDSIDSTGTALTEAELYRRIELGETECEIIAPVVTEPGDLNSYSVGILARHGQNTFIFTGDAERESEAAMVGSGHLTHITVCKAGHHGSYTSCTEEFLAEITPDIVVISCGDENTYGHPHDVLMQRLHWYTDEIYRTDTDGTIVVTSDGNEVIVSCAGREE